MANPFADNYKSPQAPSDYLKFTEEGSYLFRILTPKEEVITYWTGYTKENGETRKLIYPDKGDGMYPEGAINDPDNPARIVWAMVVYSHDTNRVMIWECSQKSLQKALANLARSRTKNDWTKFDIEVVKTGQKMETEYSLLAGDIYELSQEAKDRIESTPVRLKAMEEGKNPFETEEQPKKGNATKALNKDLPDAEKVAEGVQMPY
jgi:hypothetical protein